MSTKVIYTLPDEKQELQKQLGCMNGIFQLFGRRYLVGQRISSHNHKRPPSGQSDNGETRLHNAPEKPMEKNPKKVVKEKQRASFESSRNSFSSSCSSTFSSVECSKKAPTEPSSPILPMKLPNLSSQPPDLRDIVKDSMSREARVLLLKTMPKEEGKGNAMKHIDSPRPLLQQKTVHSRANSYDRADQNLAKLWEVSRRFKEEKNGSVPLTPKDTPRFSYDGRESRYTLKTTIKLKELPRLSLDSRQSSIRSSSTESRGNFLQDIHNRGNGTSSQILNLTQEPGSNKRPSSSVVARLMGLEALPDSISADEGEVLKIKPRLDDDMVPLSRSSRIGEEVKHNNQVFGSPRIHNEPASPKMKSFSSPRVPLEPALWKQEGGGRSSSSVYGEIEKRLTELEFKKSGKDLRALKQILEAMQNTRRRLENKEQAESQTSKCSPDYGSFDRQQTQKSNQPVSPTIKGISPLKRGEFPSAVIKPATLKKGNHSNEKKDLVGRRKPKDLTPRYKHLGEPASGPLQKMNPRTQRSSLPSKVPEYMTGENPRLQRTKNGRDKQFTGSSPSSDLSRVRRQSNVQPAESDSRTRKLKPKSTNNDQSCRFSSETTNISKQGYTVSLQSESNTTSLASQNETEVTSTDWTSEINSVYQPKDHKFRNYAARLNEDRPVADLATHTLEQPSPVSVLDAAFYPEDTPSPIKKISYAFKDNENLHFDEAEWNQVETSHLVNRTCLDQCSEFNQVKLENIKHLVHQIELLNCTNHEATTNRTTSPCENKHPDHQYITEILLASGFLEDLGSTTTIVQLHPSGHFINPELFNVLEEPKGSTELANGEYHEKNAWSRSNDKVRRKLVFDTVNDILVRKLAMIVSSELWTSNKLKGRIPRGEKLLKEMCSEIDHLQDNSNRGLDEEDDEVISIISADVRRSEAWEECSYEVPGLVLDIERLIFKDLISEVVSGGVVGLKDWQGRHCRQLFPK